MRKNSKEFKGFSLVLVSSLFYGSYGVWSRLMGDSFGSFAAGAVRCILVVIYLATICYFRKSFKKINWRRDYKWFLLMFIASAFTSAPFYYAYNHAGIAITTLIFYGSLLIGYFLFGWLFSREKYSKDKMFATVLALVGLYLTFSPQLHGALLPLGAAAVGGVASALGVVLSQKVPYGATQSALITWSTGLVINTVIAFMIHDAVPHTFHSIAWVYVLVFSVVSLMSSWTAIAASKLIEAGIIGIVGLAEAVFGVLFGVLFYAEKLHLATLLGMVMILAGASVPYIAELKQSHLRKTRS